MGFGLGGWFMWCQLSEMEAYSFTLSLDLVTQVFLSLVVVVRCRVLCYMGHYMNKEFNFGYYALVMFCFMLSMVGLCLAGNPISLILAWERLGVSRFFLINYYQAWEGTNNAMGTLLTIRVGDFYLFVYVTGALYLHYTSLYPLGWVDAFCVLVVCLTKSAQLPFSAWLPKAMSAPTPTSALVHSSTLVTAGVVLLTTYVDVSISRGSANFLLYVGLFTMVAGRLAGLVETRVKKLIAYSTMSQIGLRIMALGLGSAKVGYMLLIAHGFAKRLLFMQIGYLMHLAQNQNFRKWRHGGNLEAFMHMQVLITLMSLCGVGFFRGMVSKELILESRFYCGVNALLLFRMMLSLYLTFLYSAVIYKTLYGRAYSPYYNNQKRLLMMSLLGVEVWLVVGSFTWVLKNIRTPLGFLGGHYSERWWAVNAFLVMLGLCTCFMNEKFMSKVFGHLNISIGGLCPNMWLELFFMLAQRAELWMYSVNAFLARHIWYYRLVSKMSLTGGINRVVFVLLVVLFLLV
jgi:NADH-ubiquinone oxidoreductase chain 5